MMKTEQPQSSLRTRREGCTRAYLTLRTLRAPRLLLFVAVFACVTAAPRAQTPAQPRQVFRSGTELVLVNVVVRDKTGAVVRTLTRDDFTVTEDDKAQTITSFDFEQLDQLDAAADVRGFQTSDVIVILPPKPERPANATASAAQGPPPAPAKIDMRGRRLIVLFFDLSSMQPEELERAVKAAHDYVDKKLSPADLIAVASFATSLDVVQDFTADRERLAQVIDGFGGVNGAGFEAGGNGDVEDTADNGNAFTADDTEFNIFNTDRRLDALQTLADELSGIEQKKSVIYFSSGMTQQQDNQVQVRRTVDRANRANVSIYAADMRGLQAIVPGGDATQGSRRGTSAFSGASQRNQVSSQAASQDTLTTMAQDTGGQAFFDSNTFGQVFDKVVNDTSAYYVLGYSSSNPNRDGRFRRIRVKLKRADLKLEYRSGYYAPRDFAHSTKDDREEQLQDQLTSDLSATDLSAFVSTSYFRVGDNRYYVPLSVVVPGYQLPITKTTDKNKASIDVLGLVRDEQRRPVGRIRDTVKLSTDAADELKKKTVQYETGFEMPPGRYHVKVVVRENSIGTFGSYETDVVVPDLRKNPVNGVNAVKLSSVVVGTQLTPNARKNNANPLVRDGRELVPNVTHVVSAGQHLYFYYEVYEPAQPVKVMTSIAFFRGKMRAFETPVVQMTELGGSDKKTAIFQFDVPATSLPPGLYTCQINIVDDAAAAFTFPRFQLYVRR
jgi:VWFA-related protein